MAEGIFARLKEGRFDPDYVPIFESKLFFEGEKRERQTINFGVLLALATVIATYGVITDSTATVIGAMIVAPLMTPIMATGAAVSMGASRRAMSSITLVTLGVIGVIMLAMILTALVPGQLVSLTQNPQITSRVSPGLLDLLIALAAGAAGAFAIGRQEIADSLAGVAIAISLVPPLCVVGITLFHGGFIEAGGAFFLFLTNFIAILVAGTIMFGLMGLPGAIKMEMKAETRKKAMVAIMIASILLIGILTITSYQAYQATNDQIVATNLVTEWVGLSQYQVQKVVLTRSGVNVILVGEGSLPPLETLSEDMEEQFGRMMVIQLHTIPEKKVTYPSVLAGL
ncbi:MAG: TIGR00341 family protein [Methanoregulaceae archaeon]|jgi:uncharacterized hydrophobic protein (TIGR00271 family)|nr:TIGR00341 family protein [Methanoregulaceae archaeon]